MILYENGGLAYSSLKWMLPGTITFVDIPKEYYVPFQAPHVFVSRNSQVSFRSQNGTEVCMPDGKPFIVPNGWPVMVHMD